MKRFENYFSPLFFHIDFQAPGESMDSGDKATPKAMSVAYRTLLLQALCIPTDEPDPDAQSYDRVNGEIPLFVLLLDCESIKKGTQ